ncbi:hypothetical protein L1987_42457 [Smallanthus sonchifolius]|uniref:Uncharacterized protein n=1 Tax=Smallanthus sonchifolius TaxID=185202 RepID=A0ACB9GK03_9ASTR|nr:hypothetical protein L1987_42457 [Smallanthus sonchifolius]
MHARSPLPALTAAQSQLETEQAKPRKKKKSFPPVLDDEMIEMLSDVAACIVSQLKTQVMNLKDQFTTQDKEIAKLKKTVAVVIEKEKEEEKEEEEKVEETEQEEDKDVDKKGKNDEGSSGPVLVDYGDNNGETEGDKDDVLEGYVAGLGSKPVYTTSDGKLVDDSEDEIVHEPIDVSYHEHPIGDTPFEGSVQD